MIFQTLSLAVIGMFFALAATENNTRLNDLDSSLEESTLGCSCKKKKRNSLKEENLLACEGHDEPLEEETV